MSPSLSKEYYDKYFPVKILKAICKHCGKEFKFGYRGRTIEGNRHRRFCSKECRIKHDRRAKYKRKCGICGKEFITACHTAKTCSAKCLKSLQSKLASAKHPDKEKVQRNQILRMKRARAREAIKRKSLTDNEIKRRLHNRDRIEWNTISKEMINEERQRLTKVRDHRRNIPPPKCKVYFRKCINCLKLFTSRISSQKACNQKCLEELAFKKRSAKKIKKKICKYCGESFISEYGDKRRLLCSDKCKRGNKRVISGGRNARQKARHYGVEYEYINPKKVFDRDGWHCQICGKPTPQIRRGTNYQNAPELDHRIPISRRGPHLYSNVQCACRACNSKKSNGSNIGQMPLFEVRRKEQKDKGGKAISATFA